MELTEKLAQMIQDTQERNFMWRDASVVRDLLIECMDKIIECETEGKGNENDK